MSSAHATALIFIVPIRHHIFEFSYDLSRSSMYNLYNSALNNPPCFTPCCSPLNAAIIIEEVYREYSEKKAPFYIALLDAKSAFDVVDIDILMRKLQKLVLAMCSSSLHIIGNTTIPL
jgi:hypothetical protein